MANQHDPRANQNNSPRSPQLESLLTLKKQAQHQLDIARRNLEDAHRALETADEVQRTAQTCWEEYCDANTQWQTAQQHTEAVKTSETRISELRFRIFIANVLALGMVILAAIQVTRSSALVVILIGVLPCLLYVAAKAQQLIRVQRALPSKRIGDLAALARNAEKLRQRYERARIAVQRKGSDRPILVSRVQNAQKDVTEWGFKVNEAEVRIQAQISLERARKQQH
jgi:hypothetical protein